MARLGATKQSSGGENEGGSISAGGAEKRENESIERMIAERGNDSWSDGAGYDSGSPPSIPKSIPAHLRIPEGMILEEWMESIMSVTGEDGWKRVWSERQRWLAAAA